MPTHALEQVRAAAYKEHLSAWRLSVQMAELVRQHAAFAAVQASLGAASERQEIMRAWDGLRVLDSRTDQENDWSRVMDND
jgi:hypothetical protein